MARVKPQKKYSVAETALIFRVTEDTIRRWLRDKFLRGKKESDQGRRSRWMIKGSEINRVLKILGKL